MVWMKKIDRVFSIRFRMKDKKESNASALFEQRTGKKYENWIQAWLITLKQKKEMKT